jgi:hypothetical protein
VCSSFLLLLLLLPKRVMESGIRVGLGSEWSVLTRDSRRERERRFRISTRSAWKPLGLWQTDRDSSFCRQQEREVHDQMRVLTAAVTGRKRGRERRGYLYSLREYTLHYRGIILVGSLDGCLHECHGADGAHVRACGCAECPKRVLLPLFLYALRLLSIRR